MIQVVGNDGRLYRCGSINWFPAVSSIIYFYDDISTPISCTALWQNIQTMTAPTIPLEYAYENPTQPIIDLLNQQYYFLIGDAQHGGLAFWNYNGHLGCATMSTNDQWVNYIPIGDDGTLYLCDRLYMNGEAQNQSTAIYMDRNNQFAYYGERITIIPPIPPEVIPYVEFFYSQKSLTGTTTLQKKGGWNYIGTATPQPEGCSVYQGSDPYVSVGPVSTTLVKSPCLKGVDLPDLKYITWWDGAELVVDDPYQDTSADDEDPDSGGGGGSIHDSIDIDFPELPPEMILGSGMIKVYVPTAQNLKDLCTWLYSRPDAVITNLKKIWANPMESIISLHIVPLIAPITESEEVKFCGIGTGVYMPILQNQYMTIDCGNLVLDDGLVVPEEYKSFIDYGAFTRIRLYLPFIGIVDLNTDDVVGAQLHVKYNVDLFTGAVVAFVKSTKTNAGKNIKYNSVLYAFNGNFLLSAPITANNWGGLYQSLVGSVTHIAQATVDPIGGAAGLAGDLVSPKVHAQRSGNIVGGQGFIGEWKPYIIIERPPVHNPVNNGALNGWMCNKYLKLGDCKGFTQVTDGTMRVKNTLATDQELQMIKEELEAGVVF